MQQTNQYSTHISYHTKCLKILEAREEFIRRLNNAEDFLNRFDAADHHAPIRLMNYRYDLDHNVELYRHTVKRLTGYYERQASKICVLIDIAQPVTNPIPKEEWRPIPGSDPSFFDLMLPPDQPEVPKTYQCDFCVIPTNNDFSVVKYDYP